MRFTIEPPLLTVQPKPVQVGDVYLSKATGPKFYRSGTRFFMVAAIAPGRYGPGVAHLLGLDQAGNVVSTTSYGVQVLEGRERVGFCPMMAEANFTIDFEVDHG